MEYIEPSYPVTLPTQSPTTPTTEDGGSGDSPSSEIVPDNIQPTSTTVTSQTDDSGKISTEVVPVTTNLLTPTVELITPTTTVTCNKLRGKFLPSSKYLIMFQYNLPPPRMNELYNLLKSIGEVDNNFDLNEMKPVFQGPIKGFYYNGLNKEAIMKVIQYSID